MERSISFRTEKAIYVEDVYIEPDHRDFGLARQLLGHIVDVALSRNILRLEWFAPEGGGGIALAENAGAEKSAIGYLIDYLKRKCGLLWIG